MRLWLFKTEPSDYAYDDLVRDKRSVWSGVANNQALQHIRNIHSGDLALIYHTGDEKAVVGVASIVTNAYPDPQAGDPKIVVVDVKPKKKLKHPVTLKQIKAEPALKEWDLVRNSRLSVMPVSEAIWRRIEQLSEAEHV
jgi:predicted RNA-binding protein with PUA-like domain